jgi:hypothetical protein
MDLNLLQLHGDVGGKKPKGDAVEGDVRSGKTFSNADELGLVGTIPVRASAAQSITPGTTNIVKAAGIYDGDITILGDPDLVTANIKSGANLFGVGGKPEVLDTAEGTAPMAAGNVLSGKIGFVNGGKITGSMPDRGAVTITPSTVDQTITNGYHSGSGKVVGDPDLIAGNIKSGVNVFGVAGNVDEFFCNGLLTITNTANYVNNPKAYTRINITGSGYLLSLVQRGSGSTEYVLTIDGIEIVAGGRDQTGLIYFEYDNSIFFGTRFETSLAVQGSTQVFDAFYLLD